MRQKREIIFLNRLFSPHVGGVEKHILKLSRLLISKGFLVTIITEQFDNNLLSVEKKENLTIHRVPIGRNNFFKKFYIWKWILFNFYLFKNADIIHIHDVFYWILPFKFFLRNKKIFMTFHGYEGFPLKKSWVISRKIAEILTNGNICVGEFMKKWYGTKPNYVIYGAAEIKKPKKNIFFKNSIVFFGRLDNQTNILEYADAFKKIHGKDKSFTLDVYGEGELQNKIKKPISLFKFDEKIADILYKYEYVFVSRYLSMLEALLSKRLIFAFYDNEIKKDYLLMSPFKKFIVPVSTSDELCEKVIYYSKNQKERSKLVNSGFDFAQKQTWEKILNTYLKLWSIKDSQI